ncbi:hypothetical protein [Aeromicrobium sp. P5_D10]
MKRTSWKVAVAAGALTVLGGYMAGSVIAASADEDTSQASEPTVTDGSFPVKPEPLPDIGHGKTVGDWSIETPLDERPDFYPVALEDGTPGYVKRSDIDDELVLPLLPEGVVRKIDKKILRAAELRQRTVLVQPNAKGEIWVDVYADDAKTVIGKKMMDDVSDPPPSDY